MVEYQAPTGTPDVGESDISKLLDLETTLEIIENYFRGHTFNPKTNSFETGKLDKQMNERGVNEVMSILRLFLNKDNAFNDLRDREIGNIVLDIYQKLTVGMLSSINEWDIKNPDKIIYMVKILICRRIHLFLTQSRLGGMRDVYRGTTGTQIVHQKKSGVQTLVDGITGGGS